MMGIIQKLQGDHATMHLLLRSMQAELALFQDDYADPDYYHLSEIVRCFIHFPDSYHHPAEEKVFEFLSEHQPEYRLLLARLTNEHVEIAKCATHLYLLLDGVRTGHIVQRTALVHETEAFISDQANHMAHEEEQIFKICSRYVDTVDWLQLEMNIRSDFDASAETKIKAEFQWLWDEADEYLLSREPVLSTNS